MARPTKQGIEYFSFDVNFFSDLKVKRILRACGAKGIAVLVNLLCNIYRDKGYYMQWDDEIGFLVADEVGASESTANEVIQKALQVNFFDSGMFEKHQILTSRGIQDRYIKATYQRKNNAINEDYSLVQCESNSKSHEKQGLSHEKPDKSHEKVHKSKVKETKVNKTKVCSNARDDSTDSVWKSMVSFQKLWLFPNTVQKDDLERMTETYSDDLVDAAIKVAGSKDVAKGRAIAFIESCLKEWSDANVKTLDQAREYQRNRMNKSRTSYAQRPIRKEELPEWADRPQHDVDDPDKQAAIEARMQEYLAKQGGK